MIQRKKPLSKRFKETFTGDDTKSVGSYILFDVLIPAAKDMVADAVSQGVERKLFGEVRSTSRRGGYRPGSAFGNTSYNAYNRYALSSSPRREDPRSGSTAPNRRSRASHNFDEIILATRVEATEVIDRLFSIISQYEVATVSDLYELVGITADYTDDKWGWTDIRGADITRIQNGYLLDLPRPSPID